MADSPKSYVLLLSTGPEPDVITVRLPSPPGGPSIDFRRDVRPGGDFNGILYAELKAMGPGRHDVPAEKFRAADASADASADMTEAELDAHAEKLLGGG